MDYYSPNEQNYHHDNHHDNQQHQQQNPPSTIIIPHRGSLSRIHIDIDNNDTSISYNQPTSYIYAINIRSEYTTTTSSSSTSSTKTKENDISICQYQLQYHPDHYTFMNDLFIILDTECRGYITKKQLEEFVLLRCPVFKRRDGTIREFEKSSNSSGCDSNSSSSRKEGSSDDNVHGSCKKEDEIIHHQLDHVEEVNGGGEGEEEEGEELVLNKSLEENEIVKDEHQEDQNSMFLEKQDEQDIFNCILGEDFHSASDHEPPCDDDNDDDNDGDDFDDSNDDDNVNTDDGDDDDDEQEDPILQENDQDEENLLFLHDENDNEAVGDQDSTQNNKPEIEVPPYHNKENVDKNDNINDMKQNEQNVQSQTFEEIWNAVIQCRINYPNEEVLRGEINKNPTIEYFGIEAWMVFCRFVSLAQYQDANRRFSARHLQQQIIEPQRNSDTTMYESSHHQKQQYHASNNQNDVIIVDVAPIERPVPISAQNLIEYELLTLNSEVNANIGKIGISLPELDLDHSHLLLHDGPRHEFKPTQKVHVSVFGRNKHTTNSMDGLEFVIRLMTTTTTNENDGKEKSHVAAKDTAIVRRSYSDLSWLYDTFKSQKHVSGTLCGRIIPPFPSPLGSAKAVDSTDDKVLSSSAAISAASESAVLVTSAAKSFLGHLTKSATSKLKAVTTSTLKSSSDKRVAMKTTTKSPLSSKTSSRQQHGSTSVMRKRHTKVKESILDNADSKAKQLERFLNYMLDHPAMSTSFPLNVILRASQAGVSSAIRILDMSKDENKYNPDVSTMNQSKDDKFSFERYGITSDLSWVRSAAQAALAMKLHGLLENTGYQSTSTKLHHASLPKFSKLRDQSVGIDESVDTRNDCEKADMEEEDDDFEKGIVCIDSCLDEESGYGKSDGNGFDVLPLPIPLHKRSALCAGSSQTNTRIVNSDEKSQHKSYNEVRPSYADELSSYDQGSITVGDVSVDRDIERLRGLMQSVDNSLKKAFSSGLMIGAESSEKMNYQLEMLKEIDHGESMGLKMSPNALLNGFESLEMNRDAVNDCTEQFVNGFCWNSSLASSAVAASDEVRTAVKAAQTAQRAKHVAEEAAKNAEDVCRVSSFSSIDEKMQAMTQASDLRSQAIYAAVVEHEALTAKRRAAVALARDVKCWNVHRKKELIKTCLTTVKTYQKIAFDARCTWENLQESLLKSQPISTIVQSKNVKQTNDRKFETPAQRQFTANQQVVSDDFASDSSDLLVNTDIVSKTIESTGLQADVGESLTYDNEEEGQTKPQYEYEGFVDYSYDSKIGESTDSNVSISRPFEPLEAATILRQDVAEIGQYDNIENVQQTQSKLDDGNNMNFTYSSNHFDIDNSFHDTFQEKIPSEGEFRINELIHEELKQPNSNLITESEKDSVEVSKVSSGDPDDTTETGDIIMPGDFGAKSNHAFSSNAEEAVDDTENVMTDSMQSLVDGLMNWGGQWEEDEDIIPLPDGVAASLVEGSSLLKSQ